MHLRTALALVGGLAVLLAVPAFAANPHLAGIQVALREHGLYEGSIDGLAGPRTVRALRTFQRRAGLPATGLADARTRLALGPLGHPVLGKRVLVGGRAGLDVSSLQFELARHGFPPGAMDGRFGPSTERALRRFQRFARLAADGAAGRATFAALRAPPPRSPRALAWPLRLPVTRGFGPAGARFHPGIDIGAPYASGVAAAADGRVVWAGWKQGGLGYLVTIDHGGGLRTLYGHLSRVDVRLGQRLVRGALVGLVGWTGNARKPHLHFEVRLRGAAVDPLTALR